MAGYKVMIRVLAIIIVLGVIGFGIFYFVSGGFSNARASYETYKTISGSNERAYLQNLDSAKVTRLSNYSSRVDGKKNATTFNNYLEAYISLDLVLMEMGDELYFAPKKANNKKTVDSRYNDYKNALQATYKQFKVFDDSYNDYISAASADGTSISSWEDEQLLALAPKVYDSMSNLVKKAYSLNGVCFNFIVENCLGKSTYGNLKYAMLEAIRGQAMVLVEKIGENVAVTDIKAYAEDCDKAVKKYKNEKVLGFSSELDNSSTQYAFKNSFYSLKDSEKKDCYQNSNKQQLIDNMNASEYKQKLEQMCLVMGWII